MDDRTQLGDQAAGTGKTTGVPTDIGPLIRSGLIVLALGAAAFAGWGAVAPLNSAAIAPGVLVVESKRKAVQHLEGGIVQEIRAAEGQLVKAGSVLIVLDDTAARARLQQLDAQRVAAQARYDRLRAERDGAETIAFSEALIDRQDEAMVIQAMALQQDLRDARRQSLEGQKSVMDQQIRQSLEEISGHLAQIDADQEQAALVADQLAAFEQLFRQGHARKTQLTDLKRDAARLKGRTGELRAQVAQARQRVAETKIAILNLEIDFRTSIVEELQAVQQELNELREAIAGAEDIVRRTRIRAPQSGTVVGLNIHTVGGVVAPSETLMEIVPIDDSLVVEALVRPEDIDAVHQGMPAQIRLTAFNFRRTPALPGRLIHLSADRVVDGQTGVSAYYAKVRIDEGPLADALEFYPGMPAEVMILLGERTLLDYLAEPVLSSFNRAFRED